MATESIYPAPFDTSTFMFPAEWQALSDVFGGSATGLLFLRDGMIVHLNNSLEEQLGFDDAELIGQPVESLLLPGEKNDPRHDESNGIAGGPRDGTVRLASKSGKPVEFHLIVNRIDTLSNARYTIWVLQPPSKQAAAEAVRENAAAAARREAIAEYLPDLVLVCTPDTQLSYASHAFADLLGVERSEVQHLQLLDVVHKDDQPRLRAALEQLAENAGSQSALAFRIRNRHGSWRQIEVHASNLLAQADVAGLLLSGRDITEQTLQQHAIEADKKRQLHYLNRLLRIARGPHPDLASALKVVLKSSAKALGTHRCAYWETDGDPIATRCVLAYDDVAQNFVDEPPDTKFAAVLQPLLRHACSSDPNLVISDVDQDPRGALSCEYFHAMGIKAMMIAPVRHAGAVAGLLVLSQFGRPRCWRRDESEFAGNVAGLIALIFDEVERARTAAQLHSLAHPANLSGSARRHLPAEDTNHILSRAAENAAPLTAFFIGLDSAERAGDSSENPVGIELLKAAAMRLKSVVRENDILLRMAGDEFVLLARKLADPQIADDIAQQIVDAMHDPFSLHGEEWRIAASVGIAYYPQDGNDIDALRKKADDATLHSASSGRQQHRMFSPRPPNDAGRRL